MYSALFVSNLVHLLASPGYYWLLLLHIVLYIAHFFYVNLATSYMQIYRYISQKCRGFISLVDLLLLLYIVLFLRFFVFILALSFEILMCFFLLESFILFIFYCAQNILLPLLWLHWTFQNTLGPIDHR